MEDVSKWWSSSFPPLYYYHIESLIQNYHINGEDLLAFNQQILQAYGVQSKLQRKVILKKVELMKR